MRAMSTATVRKTLLRTLLNTLLNTLLKTLLNTTAVLAAWTAHAAVHQLTLRQAVAIAVKQNPDLALARLDEENARQAVRIAKDPFAPRVTVGSGLAYSNGFPMSIEGS